MSDSRKPLIITGLGLFILVAAGFIWLATRPAEPFMPHGHCYLWEPGLVYTHVVSDILIGLAYVSISSTLAYIVAKARRDLPFHWMFIAFGAFIVACGGTHLVEAWTVWHPWYWFAAMVKIATALASITTAVTLPRLVPKILGLLKGAHRQREEQKALEADMQRSMAAGADLRAMKEALERLVRERTSALSQANSALSLYETIFKTSAWGVAIVDTVRGLIQLANPAFARMHGYEPEDMVGMRVTELLAPESPAKLPEIHEIINAQDHLMYESLHARKDQTRFPCLTDVTIVRDPQGLPLYRFGYFQDITSQRRAEEDIRSVVTRARCILWRAIVEGREGWEIFEPNVSKFSWSLTIQDEVAAQHFQPLYVPPGGAYSRAWQASRHPDDARAMDDVAAKAFIEGRPSYSQIFRCFDKFGETLWIREEVAIVRIAHGKWQCTGVCLDVTEEHRLTEEMRQQAELLELSHDAIIVRDSADRIIFWNSGAEDLYGWQRSEVAGRNVYELLGTRTAPEEFSKALNARGYWVGQLRHTTKDGREVTVDSRHLLVNRGDGVEVVLETNHEVAAWAVSGNGNRDGAYAG